MSAGHINLDILLDRIQEDAIASTTDAVSEIRKRYPALSESEALEIHALVRGAMVHDQDRASLVVTAPPTFAMKTRTTKIAVQKFFVNDIDSQTGFDKLLRYKGRFLKIYDYKNAEDKMAALHAKVISVDQRETLITSANLSYHGQEGNIEVGTRIESKEIAKQVEDVFTHLLCTKVFHEV